MRCIHSTPHGVRRCFRLGRFLLHHNLQPATQESSHDERARRRGLRMARLSPMLELDDKLAGGAAAKAETAAAEGAAKAKEEALAKAREAACSHECTHLKGTHEAAPDQGCGSGPHSPLMAHSSRLLPVSCLCCALWAQLWPSHKRRRGSAIGLPRPLFPPFHPPLPLIFLFDPPTTQARPH